jgi:hypothetical protein
VDSETKSVDDGQLPTPVLYTVALEIRRCPVQLEYLEMVVSSERALCEALASRFNLHSKHMGFAGEDFNATLRRFPAVPPEAFVPSVGAPPCADRLVVLKVTFRTSM